MKIHIESESLPSIMLSVWQLKGLKKPYELKLTLISDLRQHNEESFRYTVRQLAIKELAQILDKEAEEYSKNITWDNQLDETYNYEVFTATRKFE